MNTAFASSSPPSQRHEGAHFHSFSLPPPSVELAVESTNGDVEASSFLGREGEGKEMEEGDRRRNEEEQIGQEILPPLEETPLFISLEALRWLGQTAVSSSCSNSFLFSKLHIKLCDFGLAQFVNEDGIIPWNGIRGSFGYIAPEILQEMNYDGKVDMWALGIIVFQLIGGYEPFYPSNRCLMEFVEFDKRYWKDISGECLDFIKKLLCREPNQRMTAREALSHPWMASKQNTNLLTL